MLSFLKSVLSFSKPQLNFQKLKMSPILLSITLNFGCSSYNVCIYIYILYTIIYYNILYIIYIILYIYMYISHGVTA